MICSFSTPAVALTTARQLPLVYTTLQLLLPGCMTMVTVLDNFV